jgi:hypothetical protein
VRERGAFGPPIMLLGYSNFGGICCGEYSRIWKRTLDLFDPGLDLRVCRTYLFSDGLNMAWH